ncbi:MAG: TonB-dependent receptor domain-containing protein [Helicobacteraceae bacterium]
MQNKPQALTQDLSHQAKEPGAQDLSKNKAQGLRAQTQTASGGLDLGRGIITAAAELASANAGTRSGASSKSSTNARSSAKAGVGSDNSASTDPNTNAGGNTGTGSNAGVGANADVKTNANTKLDLIARSNAIALADTNALASANSSARSSTRSNGNTSANKGTETTTSAKQTARGRVQDLGTIAVSATVSRVNSLGYASSLGVLQSRDLDTQQNIIDALKNMLGIDGGMDVGRQAGKQFQIRGFGYQSEERVIIKQDGVARSPGLYSNMISSFHSDTDILKRVEVVKGTSSILHGSGAIGGVITIQTKDASDYLRAGRQAGAMLGARYETNNMKSVRGALYAAPDNTPFEILAYGKEARHKTIRYAEGGSHYAQKSDDYDDLANDEKITDFFLKVGAKFGDHSAKISLFDFTERIKTTWQSLWQFSKTDEDLFVSGKITQRDYTAQYAYHPASNLVQLELKAYHSQAKYARGYDTTGSSGRTVANYTNKEHRWGLEAKNTARLESELLLQEIVAGADYANRAEYAEFIINGAAKNQPSHPNEYHNYGAYAQDTLTAGAFDLTLGARYDGFLRRIKKPGTKDFSGSRFSPRVAAAYALGELTFLAGYSESFRAPTPHETSSSGPINRAYYYLPNPNLRPEIGKELEAGSYANTWQSGTLSAKAMFFDGKIKDMIDIRPRKDLGTPPADGSLNSAQYGQYINVDSARRRGAEITASHRTDKTRVVASFETLRLYDEKTNKNINNHADKIILSAGFSPVAALDLNMRLSHWLKPNSKPTSYEGRVREGGRIVTKTFYYADKAFSVVDLWARLALERVFTGLDALTLKVGVNNVFDKQYINANRTKDTPIVGLGRNIWSDLELRF